MYATNEQTVSDEVAAAAEELERKAETLGITFANAKLYLVHHAPARA